MFESHPYFPESLILSAPFTPRVYSQNDILGGFFVGTFLLTLLSFGLARNLRHLTSRLLVLWFMLCGVIHTFVEGYFVLNNASIASQTTFLAELWKEYGLSDSRYLNSDPSVLVIEGITAVLWGPLSFLAAYLIITKSPWRHVLAIIISVGQCYGDVLYYATTLIEGAPHCRPEPFYFWAYFVFANCFWIIIPLLIIGGYSRQIVGEVRGPSTPKAGGGGKRSSPRSSSKK